MSRFFYSTSVSDFRSKDRNTIVNLIARGAKSQGIFPSESEIASWGANVEALKAVVEGLNDDAYIGFEYKLPVGGRIDCVLMGVDNDDKKHIYHIELKQWSNDRTNVVYDQYLYQVDIEGCRGGASRFCAHPSQQVGEYHNYLLNNLEVFDQDDITLHGVAYCYNYIRDHKNNHLFDEYYKDILKDYPIYTSDTVAELKEDLKKSFSKGQGAIVCKELAECKVRPTKHLRSSVANMFEGKTEFQLIGNQLDAYNAILGAIKHSKESGEKAAIIVKGGPGTGKSVIALRLAAELSKKGNEYDVKYVTRSSSLRKGLKTILGNKTKGLIEDPNNVKPNWYIEGELDVILVDEAHRMESSSNIYYQRKEDGVEGSTFLPQALSLLYTSKVSVFFIDDNQSIIPSEIGNSFELKRYAEGYVDLIKESIKNREHEVEGDEQKEEEFRRQKESINLKGDETINVVEIELSDQFRCDGNDGYLEWLNDVLYNGGKGEKTFSNYEFEVFDNPNDLYRKIRSKDAYASYCDSEECAGLSYQETNNKIKGRKFSPVARLSAGWCWPWKKKNNRTADGDLIREVKFSGETWSGEPFEFAMPWETSGNLPKGEYRYKYARNAEMWSTEPQGVNQIGAVHALQGWDLDYAGVIIGPDLIYDKENDCLKGNTRKGVNKQKGLENPTQEIADKYFKNIYRVLMSRGMKGCYIFCCDPEVGKFFKRQLDKAIEK